MQISWELLNFFSITLFCVHVLNECRRERPRSALSCLETDCHWKEIVDVFTGRLQVAGCLSLVLLFLSVSFISFFFFLYTAPCMNRIILFCAVDSDVFLHSRLTVCNLLTLLPPSNRLKIGGVFLTVLIASFPSQDGEISHSNDSGLCKYVGLRVFLSVTP